MKRSLLTLGLAAGALLGQGIQPADLDRSVKPCEDFYQFANGGWLKRTTLPADKARYGAFEELIERNRTTLKAIFDETSARKDWKAGSLEQRVGDCFASGMDEATIERRGLAPLAADRKLIDGLQDAKALPALLGRLHNTGIPGGFGFFVSQDARESTRYIGHLGQGGLGLPDRDYYLKDDARSKEIRSKYVAHVARMFTLSGVPAAIAEARAGVVLDLETRMAQAAWSRVENRDPVKRYNKRSLEALAKDAPGFDFAAYFKARGVSQSEVIVAQPSYFAAFAKLSAEVPAAQWRTYLHWHLLRDAASALPKAFGDATFDFYGRTLNGTTEQEPRWKRVEGQVDGALGELVGQLYVKRAFSPEAKQKVLALVANVRAALKERIQGLAWMGEATKTQALHKLDAITVKMGYPDKWKGYEGVTIHRNDYFGNLRRADHYAIARNLGKLGKPIDRTEWGMTPPTVNAYYSPTMNEIVFPAGILQPPFFDPKADDAVNYGAIGWVIGHEITHGFDDSGSQYDADGNLKNWWTDADRKNYESRTDLVVKQYDAFEPLKGEHVNGKLTLGENIADLGGLKIAFAAWQKSLAGSSPAPIDGFTGAQRFFLGAARVWRNHIRPEALSVRLKTDPHSPGRERVLGPLSNLPEFFEAFGCEDGAPMKRDSVVRPSIW